jgi:hypothetical protein
MYLGTYESRCSHIGAVDCLASLFDSCSKLATFIQAKAIPYSAKFHVILRIIYHGKREIVEWRESDKHKREG